MTAALIDALGGFAGVTIRVRHELPEASMRLLDTLGAHVVIDPAAEPCERIVLPNAPGSEDHYSSRMCPMCRAVTASLGETAECVSTGKGG